VKNIEDSRDFLELEAKDIKHIFKDKADRVLDIHMMGYDTLPEFRKKCVFCVISCSFINSKCQPNFAHL